MGGGSIFESPRCPEFLGSEKSIMNRTCLRKVAILKKNEKGNVRVRFTQKIFLKAVINTKNS